jgi:DNA-binding CsgD family transcriptional regulator
VRRTPLLERDGEVAAVLEAISDVLDGRGRLVAVEGEAGVGKTRLLTHLRDLPEASTFRVFTARGSELERPFAFGVVRQLYEPALTMAGDSERRRLLSGAARAAAAVFSTAGPTALDADLAVLHGLYWLTANLSERPAVMLVDDVQWADAASLRFLAYLIPRLEDLRLLVVIVMRTGERPAEALSLRRAMAAPDVVVLRPKPLTEAGTAALLAEVLERTPQPEFTAACFQATSGNPLLLHALAGHVAREGIEPTAANSDRVTEVGSRAVAHFVSERLENAGEDLGRTARAVAVLGQSTSLVAVAELAGVELVAAEEAVGELAAMGLLDPASPSPAGDIKVSYSHPLMAAAVYRAMSARDRAEAHRRAAAILARLGSDPERVGAHLLKTPPGGSEDVTATLRRAATAAESRGSAEAALSFLLRSLDEIPDGRPELLIDAARVAVQVDVHAAVRLLEQAKGLTRDPATVARISAELGRAYGFLLEPQRAYDAFYEALASLPANAEDERRRLEATLLVGAFIVPGRLDVRRRLPALTALPPQDGLGGLMLEAAISLHEAAECDPNGRRRARAALTDGRLVREANGEGALVCGWLTLLAADDEAAIESLDMSVEQAHLYGSRRALAAAYCFRALGRVWRGQLAEAERDAREALRLAETRQVDMDPTFAGGYLTDVLVEQGRLAEAEAVLRSVGVPGTRSPKPRYSALDSYARLLRQQGRHEAAVTAAMEAGEAWRSYGYRNPALGSWRTEGSLSLLALGRVEEARALAHEELDLAEQWGAPRAVGRALRVLGQVTGGADAIADLQRSIATLTGSGARLELATALLELGSAVRRSGHRAAARQHLTQALDLAEVCGAPPLGERAATELRAAGYRPRRHRLTGVDALTPSELRVAEAAARGATNREIAQALFVTTKTVEVHLSSAFRKLGVSRRTQLTKHLAGAGLG